MVITGIIKKGLYFDSVTLMIAAHKIKQTHGIIDSAVVMGTRENKAILEASGFLIDLFHDAEDTDLLIAVKTETPSTAETALDPPKVSDKGNNKSFLGVQALRRGVPIGAIRCVAAIRTMENSFR